MALGLLLLLTGGVLGYLTVVDRMSPVALYAVELNSAAGLPVWSILVVAGAALMVGGLFKRRRRPVAPKLRSKYTTATHEKNQHTQALVGAGGDWKADVFNQARALVLEGGARVQLNKGTSPLGLLLERSTTERARRNIDAFARFLAVTPLPPRVLLTFKDCPIPPTPWGKLVEGIFRQHFAAGTVNVIAQHERIDIVFRDPDPRWMSGD